MEIRQYRNSQPQSSNPTSRGALPIGIQAWSDDEEPYKSACAIVDQLNGILEAKLEVQEQKNKQYASVQWL